jgi:Holliday junction DNA helicase RuvA
MIASLTGTLTQKSPSFLIVDVRGVGYQVVVPLMTYYRLPEVDAVVTLHIYTHVREDALQLYGFLTRTEKELFLLCLGVSGVGPKLALSLLSGIEPAELVGALRSGSAEKLRAIPGVGPRTAGRLVLELADKVAALHLEGAAVAASGVASSEQPMEDALSALMNLGYPRFDAKRALEGVRASGGGTVEALVKQALKVLAGVG